MKPGAIAHVPGLDGLRGIAVLGVLFFHANARLRGGYLGVDLFFVLSGFLITSILLEEHARAGAIDLRAFWVRRARRLLPALFSLVPAIALYAKTLAAPAELATIRADALATLAYVANWRAIFVHRSYWEMFARPSPLEHTWSLAIEEQFYVVWPLVVAGLLALRRRALLVVTVTLMLASAVAMAVLFDEASTTRVYLGTDTRGAAILAGATLAISGAARADRGPAPRWLEVAGVVSAFGLGVAWWSLDGQDPLLYKGGFWATELAAVVLIACAVRAPAGIVARALSFAPLRAAGTVSYGVYLWHWPVYVVLTEERLRIGAAALLAVRLVVTFAIAVASYRFLERPIRLEGLRWRPVVVIPAVVALSLGFILFSTRPVGASPKEVSPALATPARASPARADSSTGASVPHPPAPIPFGFIPPASELPPGTLRVLVLGDSVALALGARMHFAQDTAEAYVDHRAIGDCSILDGIAPVFSMSGPPHDNGNCARNWIADVKELEPDVSVVILGGAYFSTVRVDGRRRSPCHPGWGSAYRKRLAELLRGMAPHTKRRIVVSSAYPVGKWQTPTRNDDVDCYNKILSDAAIDAGAETLDLNAFACPDKVCTLTSRDAPVRPDGLHFDGLGAEDTARWVLHEIRRTGGKAQGRDRGTPE